MRHRPLTLGCSRLLILACTAVLFMRRSPRGCSRATTPGSLQRHHRGGAGHVVRRNGAAAADRRWRALASDTNVASFMSSVGRRAAGASEPGQALRRAQAGWRHAPSADAMVAELTRAHRPASPGSPSISRTRRRSASAGGGSKSLYQFTLQGNDIDDALRRGRNSSSRGCSEMPMLTAVTSDLLNANPIQSRCGIDRDRARCARRDAGGDRERRSPTRTTSSRSRRSTRPPTSTGW